MPTIHRLSNCKICMYPDHAPPHFHLLGPGWSATIHLHTLGVLRGDPPKTDLAEALEWARKNKSTLEQKWSELNERDD